MKDIDREVLIAAREGLAAKLEEFQGHLRTIDAILRGDTRHANPVPDAHSPATAPAPKGKRKLSAAARKRISAAQKKRWSEYNKSKEKKK